MPKNKKVKRTAIDAVLTKRGHRVQERHDKLREIASPASEGNDISRTTCSSATRELKVRNRRLHLFRKMR